MVPATTHAVIVGIECYDAGWALNGAADDALRAAAWLRKATVPAGQITLIIGALAENRPRVERVAGELGIAVRTSARRGDIERVFTRELVDAAGENLVVYWSGHGVLDENHERALFTGDAAALDMQNIRLDRLLNFLYDARITGFHRQLVIVDACANFVEEMANEATLPESTFAHTGRRGGVEQFVFYAAAQGQAAAHDQSARGGLFSKVVLGWLDGPNGPQWPPDLPALSAHIAGSFEALREAGTFTQTPVSLLRSTDRADNRVQHDYGGLPISGPAARASAEAGLTPAQLRRLAAQLAQIPLLATPAQRAQLGREVSGDQVVAAEDPIEHLRRVLAAALRRGAMDQLLEKLKALSDNEDERLAVEQADHLWRLMERVTVPLAHFAAVTMPQLRTYYDVVPDRQQAPTLEDLDAVLEYLADLGPAGESAPLLRFAARLELLTGSPIEDDWFRLSAQGLQRLRERAEAALNVRSGARLVLDLTESGSAEPAWPTELVGHLRGADGGWEKQPVKCSPTIAGTRQAVNELIVWAHKRKSEEDLALGFLAPRARFDDTPESWCYSDDMYEDFALREQYPVVLHSRERLRNPRACALWRGRLRRIADELDVGGQPTIVWLEKDDARDPRSLSARVEKANASCVGFGFVPGKFGGALPADPLVAAIRPGAPYVIWLDEEPEDWQAAKDAIEALVRQGDFHKVPDRALPIRKGEIAGISPAIRLVWDKQEWLPEFGQLTGLDG